MIIKESKRLLKKVRKFYRGVQKEADRNVKRLSYRNKIITRR